MSGYATSSIAELEGSAGWSPIRRHFGIRAFGVNAWTAHAAGATLIAEHDEAPSGHEELYVVTEGSAVFTVDGDEIEAPAGTIVHVADPALSRKATARDAPATIVSIGGPPGKAYSPRAWEVNADVLPLFDRGDFAAAKGVLEQALEDYEDTAGTLYNLACAEARLGERDAALAHLSDAVAADARFAEYARSDEDLAAVRDDPRFPA